MRGKTVRNYPVPRIPLIAHSVKSRADKANLGQTNKQKNHPKMEHNIYVYI